MGFHARAVASAQAGWRALLAPVVVMLAQPACAPSQLPPSPPSEAPAPTAASPSLEGPVGAPLEVEQARVSAVEFTTTLQNKDSREWAFKSGQLAAECDGHTQSFPLRSAGPWLIRPGQNGVLKLYPFLDGTEVIAVFPLRAGCNLTANLEISSGETLEALRIAELEARRVDASVALYEFDRSGDLGLGLFKQFSVLMQSSVSVADAISFKKLPKSVTLIEVPKPAGLNAKSPVLEEAQRIMKQAGLTQIVTGSIHTEKLFNSTVFQPENAQGEAFLRRWTVALDSRMLQEEDLFEVVRSYHRLMLLLALKERAKAVGEDEETIRNLRADAFAVTTYLASNAKNQQLVGLMKEIRCALETEQFGDCK